MNLRKLKIILAFISSTFLITGFAQQQEEEPTVMIFSADGRYTGDKRYVSVRVIESEIALEGFNLKYTGTLFNSGTDSLDKIQLILDLYGEHPLIKESLSPIYQCKKSLENILPTEESVDFSGHCKIPQVVAENIKKHRVSIGKQ
ncbi:hypothetical protein L0668_07505 [Paraglaciecola aquimarina]|uniref:Uncharacterized protein n=1 Tax=Paraglaciecola algarum TaxID=3050085 RepID=A0ABS9D7F8_9ALTE|nr:hypothetical protein [Paraglaciecola sp. G1-23]MCF2947947.1 hypothetical protein [Paraglaciecola sp. G1-23]